MSLYSEEAFNSGNWVTLLWKKSGEPDWDEECCGFLARSVAWRGFAEWDRVALHRVGVMR